LAQVLTVPVIAGLMGKKIPLLTWFAAIAALFGVGLLETSGAPPSVGRPKLTFYMEFLILPHDVVCFYYTISCLFLVVCKVSSDSALLTVYRGFIHMIVLRVWAGELN